MSGGVTAAAGACELVWVDGPDAVQFLQGLVTNDVAGLPMSGSCRALLLDNTGHIQADMRVARTGEQDFSLVVAAGGADLVERLETFHFSEDIDIIGPEAVARVTLTGWSGAALAGADLILPGLVPDTVDAIGVDADAIITAAGATRIDPGALEARRVAAGIAMFGVDFTSANLVQEVGLEAAAVSFDKGCYLGQETVARVHYRGQVNRRLRGIALTQIAATPAALYDGERRVGMLTSIGDHPGFGPIGLAIVRREIEPSTLLRVDDSGAIARTVELPFTERSQMTG